MSFKFLVWLILIVITALSGSACTSASINVLPTNFFPGISGAPIQIETLNLGQALLAPNKEATPDSTSSGGPDLIIEIVTWSPENPSAGDRLTFAVTLKNQGSDRTDSSNVDCYIDDTRVNSTPTGPLNAGASLTITFIWKSQPGSHTIKAVANSTGSVTESDETNNTATFAFSVLAPDLVVDNITCFPQNPQIEDNVTFVVTVRNQGNSQATNSRLEFYIDGVSRGYQGVQRLDAGATTSSTFLWVSKPGTHHVEAVADVLSQVVEADESNNTKSVTYSTLAPDFVIQSITWSPAIPLEDDYVTLTVTTGNQGKGKSYSSSVGCYIDNTFVSSAFLSPLAAGAAGTATFHWTATPGSHTVKAVADVEQDNAESDESNNTKTISLPTPDPDLVVQGITVSPASPSFADKVTFTVTVKNQGNSGTIPFRLDFNINTAAYSAYFDGISAGAEAKATFPWVAQAGSHTVKAVVDAEGRVIESDESNNIKTGTLSIAKPPSPDLLVQDIVQSPVNPVVGDKMTFTATVKNQGSARAGSSNLDYYVDDTRVTSAFVGPLNAGASLSFTFTWAAQPGSHTIKAIIDKADNIIESDEANNEKIVTISISTPAGTATSPPAAQPIDVSAPGLQNQKPELPVAVGTADAQVGKVTSTRSPEKGLWLNWWLIGSIAFGVIFIGVTSWLIVRRRKVITPD